MSRSDCTLVFVYGSLLRGESNHRVLGGARLVAHAITAPRYTLIDLGAFPAMLDRGNTPIRGEVYRCDAETLARLDRLEGHPRFYERRDLVLVRGPSNAQGYFLVGERPHAAAIRLGDWRAYRQQRDDERDPEGVLRDIARGRLTPRALAAIAAMRRNDPMGGTGGS